MLILYVNKVAGKWDETELFRIFKEKGFEKYEANIDNIEKNELYIYNEDIIKTFLNYKSEKMIENIAKIIKSQERIKKYENQTAKYNAIAFKNRTSQEYYKLYKIQKELEEKTASIFAVAQYHFDKLKELDKQKGFNVV